MSTFSEEHKSFIQKKKKEKKRVRFFQFFFFLLFLLTWEILTKLSILNSFLYSSPSKIFQTILLLFQKKELFYHIGITLWEVSVSFFLSSLFGILFAYLLWRFPFFARVLDPYITILNSLPKVALGPLIIIWVGANMNSIIFMALLISLFTTIINIYHGFLSVNKEYILLLKSFHATQSQLFFKVILPSNIIPIMTTLKINISMSLIGVIMGELLVSKKGLGYLIMYGSQVFQLDLVLTSVFLLGIISYMMYLLLDFYILFLKRKANH